MAELGLVVGQGLPRNEDEGFVTGRARYGADLSVGGPLGGPVDGHVVFVRSPYAHAGVLRVDTSAADRAPGVLATFSAADLTVAPPGRFSAAIPSVFAQPLLAERRVRYVGEPVAAVVASSPEAAVDAAELVEVDYEPLAPVLELDDALSGAVLLFPPGTEPTLDPGAPAEEPHLGGNVAVTVEPTGSDPTDPSPFDAAEVVIHRRLMNPRMSPAPIEARVVTCSWPSAGPLLVVAATQRPHGHRDELCRLYHLEPDEVVVIAPEVGGGFGGKNSRTVEECLLPHLARSIGGTVRWVETRSEYLAAATQSRGERLDVTLAGTAAGDLQALKVDLVKDCGAYPITGAVLPGAFTSFTAGGPYDIGHVEFSACCIATNRVPTSAFRGAGRAPYLAALERMVDLYARRIGADPAEVRRRNLIRPEAMPYRAPTGAVYDEADYPADLETALALLDYPARRVEQAERRTTANPRQLGIGIACYNHMTVGGGGEEASVTLLAGGRARIVTGSTSQGHGHAITWAQIAADALSMPVADIEVVEGRTDAIATGVGAVGSRSVQTAGIAVHRSSLQLVDEARSVAAELLEAALGDVVLELLDGEGRFHVIGTPARAVSWSEVAAQVAAVASTEPNRPVELSCGELFDNEGANTYPSGTHVAIVEVDVETGAVALLRFAAVDDAGVRVNPTLVDGQLHGGIAAGIGQALGEEIRYDDEGNLRTASFIDYAVPTADELPFFELAAAEVPSSYNELGVKGVGESGTIGATPAVHNAVVDALGGLGVEHLDLPCTAQRIWEAIVAADNEAQAEVRGEM